MKGPKPVCTSATRKTNQSSLARLRREGWGGEGGGISVTGACYGRGSRVPEAPRTTVGLPSLYSGAAFT